MTSLHEWLRTGSSLAALGLVIWGWFCVNRQNNARERRKEMRQLVDRTLERIDIAVDMAMRYHAGKTDASVGRELESWRLTLALDEIANLLVLLDRARLKNATTCRLLYIHLKRVITGGDFMTTGWKNWSPGDPRWLNLLEAKNDLMHMLDRVFFESYH